MLKKVLIVTTYFPPAKAVGAIRLAKFAKYLPEFGWQPIVLTVPSELPLDNGETSRPTPVYTAPVPTLRTLYKLGRGLLPRSAAIKPPVKTDFIGKEKSFSGRAEVINSWVFVPDQMITWFPFAVSKGLQIAKTHSIQTILSTSPDPTCHLVAKYLSRRLKCPWGADFRDPWAKNPFVFYPTSLHYKISVSLEKAVVRAARHIFTVSHALRDDFVSGYPDEPSTKFSVLTNGYDREDFPNLTATASDNCDAITIVHNGAFFYAGKDPFPFLKAVQLLVRQSKTNIKVKFVGVSPLKLAPTLLEWGLADTVETIERKPHLESLPYLFKADILLLVSGPGRGVLTSKVFEYLFTGKPILALTPHDGSLAQLLQQANVGMVVDSEEPQEIANAILRLVGDLQAHRLPQPNWDFIEQFDYRNLTGQLARILDDIL